MQESVRALIGSVRESITEIENEIVDAGAARALTRVLAHLWSAHDELELLSAHRPARPAHAAATP